VENQTFKKEMISHIPNLLTRENVECDLGNGGMLQENGDNDGSDEHVVVRLVDFLALSLV
jgi:hypothetical protein